MEFSGDSTDFPTVTDILNFDTSPRSHEDCNLTSNANTYLQSLPSESVSYEAEYIRLHNEAEKWKGKFVVAERLIGELQIRLNNTERENFRLSQLIEQERQKFDNAYINAQVKDQKARNVQTSRLRAQGQQLKKSAQQLNAIVGEHETLKFVTKEREKRLHAANAKIHELQKTLLEMEKKVYDAEKLFEEKSQKLVSDLHAAHIELGEHDKSKKQDLCELSVKNQIVNQLAWRLSVKATDIDILKSQIRLESYEKTDVFIKLNRINDYVQSLNLQFKLEMEKLVKDFGMTNFFSSIIDATSGASETSEENQQIKMLERNLFCMSNLVRDTFNECLRKKRQRLVCT